MYLLLGFVILAAGVWLFRYELARFKQKEAPTGLKIIEAIIASYFWIAVPMIFLGLMALIQGVKNLLG